MGYRFFFTFFSLCLSAPSSFYCVCVLDVGGPADPIAPSIIISPKNTSVTMGRNEAIMECVANARYDGFSFFPTHTHTHTQSDAKQRRSCTQAAARILSKHLLPAPYLDIFPFLFDLNDS